MRTADRILDAAEELFGTHGYEATSIREIAERCGLTDAAVLYHFGSKRTILERLWQRLDPPSVDNHPPSTADTAAHINAIIDLLLTETGKRDPAIRLLVRQSLAGDQVASTWRSQGVAAWRNYLTRTFASQFDEAEAARRGDALMMLIVGWIIKGEIDHGRRFPQECMRPAYRARIHRLAQVVIAPCSLQDAG